MGRAGLSSLTAIVLLATSSPGASEPGIELAAVLEEANDAPAFVPLGEHSRLGTQDADPLGAGAWQFQVNYGHERSLRQWDRAWSATRRERASMRQTEAVFTYGASDALDLGLAIGFARVDDDASGLKAGSGFSDVVLSAKWRFLEDASRHLAYAFVPALTIPTGAKSTARSLRPGQEYWGVDLRLAMVKDWSPRWSTNLDVGYEAFVGDRSDSLGGLGANLALGYFLVSWFQPQVEIHYGHDFARIGSDASLFAVTVGAVAPLSDALCARVGLRQGIAGRNADQLRTFLLSLDVNF